ncbi:hypothetical protein HANVADRAFT_117900 [Hanseniaspora valbyensis NRRL Y-1626]|uniref:Uncharacterized protein n=1 Tax=Hanseniaspora valbyensis NRRL Y-1626 TaxID=766949 RepID=A0A1B7T9V4_9ASCO|nr:hypothetical protein HANVADRAFT_117900 [Hanseniaspora valbyensis NRRL Y-1626]
MDSVISILLCKMQCIINIYYKFLFYSQVSFKYKDSSYIFNNTKSLTSYNTNILILILCQTNDSINFYSYFMVVILQNPN